MYNVEKSAIATLYSTCQSDEGQKTCHSRECGNPENLCTSSR
ncbi:hypothetical protein [Planktothricoides sp. SR001]|nr:hypothetical protein [Planktothricoides sp. SR001]